MGRFDSVAVPDVVDAVLGFSPELELTFFDPPLPQDKAGGDVTKVAEGTQGGSEGGLLCDPSDSSTANDARKSSVHATLPSVNDSGDDEKLDQDLVGPSTAWMEGCERSIGGGADESVGLGWLGGLSAGDAEAAAAQLCAGDGAGGAALLLGSTIDSFEGGDLSAFLRTDSDAAPFLSLLDDRKHLPASQAESNTSATASPSTSPSPPPETAKPKTRASKRRTTSGAGPIRRTTSKAKKEAQQAKIPDGASRGAVMARINREKKKAYIAGLEEQVETLTDQRKEAAAAISLLKDELQVAKAQISYFKDVLRNQSQLAHLLQHLGGVAASAKNTNRRATTRRSNDVNHTTSRVIPLQINVTIPMEP